MDVDFITREDWADTVEVFHLTPAVKVGDVVHISGATGRSRSRDPEQQFTAAFEDVARTLSAAELSWADVVKMTTYHVGGLRAHLDVLLEVKDRYVREPYPAWTGVGVTELANPDALIEIDVIAAVVS